MAINQTTTAHTDPRQVFTCSIEGEVTDRPEDIVERVQAKYGRQLAAEGKKVAQVVHAVNLKEWMPEALDGWLRVRYSVTEL